MGFRMYERSLHPLLKWCVLEVSSLGSLVVNFYMQNLSMLMWLLGAKNESITYGMCINVILSSQ